MNNKKPCSERQKAKRPCYRTRYFISNQQRRLFLARFGQISQIFCALHLTIYVLDSMYQPALSYGRRISEIISVGDPDTNTISWFWLDYRCMESILLPDITWNIADTIWSSPRYHGEAYECKIQSVVIIIAHR